MHDRRLDRYFDIRRDWSGELLADSRRQSAKLQRRIPMWCGLIPITGTTAGDQRLLFERRFGREQNTYKARSFLLFKPASKPTSRHRYVAPSISMASRNTRSRSLSENGGAVTSKMGLGHQHASRGGVVGRIGPGHRAGVASSFRSSL